MPTAARFLIGSALAILLAPWAATAQQEQLAAIKQTVVKNQQALAAFTWKQRTEMRQEGEVRNVRVEQVRFGPDGEIQKTLLSQPPEPKKRRGLRGKIAARKIADVKDYIERLMSLAQRYLAPPPFKFPEMIKKAEIWQGRGAAGGITRLDIRDFVKAGDEVMLTLDSSSRRPRSMEAKSELDGDEVLITADYKNIPDGPTYLASMTVDGAAKQVQIRIENSDYQRLAKSGP